MTYNPTTANDSPAVPDVTADPGFGFRMTALRAQYETSRGKKHEARLQLRECARELGALLKSAGLTWGDVLPTEPCQECGVESHTLTAGTDGLRRCRDCVRDRLEALNHQIDFADPPRGRRFEPRDRATVLASASRAVFARGDKHGTPTESFSRIAHLWSNILQHKVEPHEVALCMNGVKIIRAAVDPTNFDNWVDQAGWAACGAEVAPTERTAGARPTRDGDE